MEPWKLGILKMNLGLRALHIESEVNFINA